MLNTNTLDYAKAAAEAARKSLASSVATGNLSQLAYEMEKVANAEGVLQVYQMIAVMDRNDTPTNERIEELTRMITYGADDAGSGRGNDIRRAQFDGIRTAVSRELGRMYRKLDNQING